MSVAIFALLVLVSLILLLWLAQEKVVFQPPKKFSSAHSGIAKRIEYHAADGLRLSGFLIEPEQTSHGVLLCFHGNADLAAWQIEWGREVAQRAGHSVFLSEYRGYYGIGGKSTYLSSALDADAAYRAALDATGMPPEAISFFGHSLGSAVAAELAARVPPKRLLLQSPFTSALEMVRVLLGRPLVPLWRPLSRVHFDTARRVEALAAPVSVIHGARDRIVPVEMGQAVYSAARVKGTLLIVPEAGHNDLPAAGGVRYWSWLEDSLA